jgi:hypothetical protein
MSNSESTTPWVASIRHSNPWHLAWITSIQHSTARLLCLDFFLIPQWLNPLIFTLGFAIWYCKCFVLNWKATIAWSTPPSPPRSLLPSLLPVLMNPLFVRLLHHHELGLERPGPVQAAVGEERNSRVRGRSEVKQGTRRWPERRQRHRRRRRGEGRTVKVHVHLLHWSVVDAWSIRAR